MRLLVIVYALLAAISMVSCLAKADSLTVSPVGLTIHGTEVSSRLAKDMPRRLDDQAVAVWHPEVSLLYKTRKMQYTSSYLRDCVDNSAFMVAAGPYWKTSKNTSLGLVGGVYGREIYEVTTVQMVEDVKRTTIYTMPDLGPLKVESNGWQYTPIVMGTASYRFQVSKKTGIELNLGTNIILTHMTLGVSFGGL